MAASAAWPGAVADGREYYGPISDAAIRSQATTSSQQLGFGPIGDGAVLTTPDCGASASDPNIGGACFPANHVAPDAEGLAILAITDLLIPSVSGVYCQDLDSNLLCGENDENRIGFCSSQVIESGDNWDEGEAIFVLLDGPLSGSPVFTPCGDLEETVFSPGFRGNVVHT